MAKAPTVYDVAERAGVSIATVSFAFRRPERVRAATRDAVLSAARDLGYVPSASARGLAYGRTGALGLVAFDYLLNATLTAPSPPPEDALDVFPVYVDEVQRGVELECWRRGYALLLNGGGGARSEAVIADVAGRVDALMVFPDSAPPQVLDRIAGRIPVVQFSRSSESDGYGHVTADNVGGQQALTRHLITTHGMDRLVFVGDPDNWDARQRFAGFAEAMQAAGLSVPDGPLTARGDVRRHAAEALSAVFDRPGPMPQALVCATDQIALAVLAALDQRGLAAPRDVAVTGFDGILAGLLSQPRLTTVRQPMEQMGRVAVGLLVDALDALETRDTRDTEAARVSPTWQRELPVELVIRESCGCRPGQPRQPERPAR